MKISWGYNSAGKAWPPSCSASRLSSLVAGFFTVLTLLAGCGNNVFSFLADKNSAAADSTAVQMALDSGDPNAAISILGGGIVRDSSGNITQLPAGLTAEDAQKLAAAYMELAGLNTVTLAQNAANLKNSNLSTGNFSAISSIFPAITSANLTAINNAIYILEHSGGAKPSKSAGIRTASLTKDQSLQLGIAEVAASVIVIGLGDGSNPGYDNNGLPNWCHGNCATASTTWLTTPPSPIPTAFDGTPLSNPGDYIGFYLSDAAKNILVATASTTGGTNQVAQVVQNIVYDVQTGSCDTTAPSGYTPVSPTGVEIAAYINTCLK